MVHPSAEPAGLHLPDGVPVDVGRALVGDLAVGEAANRVGVEQVSRCGDRERCRTARRRCRSGAVGWCRAASRWRPCGRDACPSSAPRRRCCCRRRTPTTSVCSVAGLAFVGLLLEEVADRRRRFVDLFVQLPVDVNRAGHPHGANGHVSGGVSRDDRRRHGRRLPRWASRDRTPVPGRCSTAARPGISTTAHATRSTSGPRRHRGPMLFAVSCISQVTRRSNRPRLSGFW